MKIKNKLSFTFTQSLFYKSNSDKLINQKPTKNKQTSILLTNLINNRIYLGLLKTNWRPKNKKYLLGFKNNFCIFDLNQTVVNFRNSFKLINKFHKSKKKILFVGFPKLEKDKICCLLRKNRHYYLPSNSWVNGLLTNNQIILNKFKSKSVNYHNNSLLDKYGGVLKLNKKPDLVVIYNNSSETVALKESLNLNIPVISFINTEDHTEKIAYKIPGGFYSNESGKIYYNLLSTIFNQNLRKIKPLF